MPIKTLLNKADASKVIDGLKDAKANNFPSNLLLPSGNQFSASSSPGNILKNHNCNPVNINELKEYMAVSTIAHNIEGWSYISQSIQALINGDHSISMHLAYYAELRGAFSFLSSEGVLILNSHQVCLDSSNNIYIPGVTFSQKLRYPATHSATWDILQEWIQNNTLQTNALEYFKYKNKTFKELIPFIPHAPSSQAAQLVLIKKWIEKWCFDISQFKSDREVRNTSSYNVSINKKHTPEGISEKLKTINGYWKVLEPHSNSFSILDQQLFALYLDAIYITANNRGGPQILKNDFLDGFFQNSGITKDPLLVDMFVNGTQSNIIKQALDTNYDLTNGVKPLTVIARAILLLRFSLGACNFLLRQSNVNRSDINFYIQQIGEKFGIWDSSSPADLNDLWVDIDELLTEFDDYLKQTPPSNIYDFRTSFSNFSPIYTQFNRAGLWGLGI